MLGLSYHLIVDNVPDVQLLALLRRVARLFTFVVRLLRAFLMPLSIGSPCGFLPGLRLGFSLPSFFFPKILCVSNGSPGYFMDCF